MSQPPPEQALDALLQLDRLIHEPSRLAILTVLSEAEWVEFSFLEAACRLSKGNLSSHLSKLEAAGFIEIDKRFRGKRPLTSIRLIDSGRQALNHYRQQLLQFMQNS